MVQRPYETDTNHYYFVWVCYSPNRNVHGVNPGLVDVSDVEHCYDGEVYLYEGIRLVQGCYSIGAGYYLLTVDHGVLEV